MRSADLYHDDAVADFGGNDGTAAAAFFARTCIKPVVVDCEPERLTYAAQKYGLPTRQAFVEALPFADKAIRWAFCSHTMEHAREPEKALREIARVVAGACYFVMPLESHKHGEENHAHAIVCRDGATWKRLLEANGWRVTIDKTQPSQGILGTKVPAEYECIAVPRA